MRRQRALVHSKHPQDVCSRVQELKACQSQSDNLHPIPTLKSAGLGVPVYFPASIYIFCSRYYRFNILVSQVHKTYGGHGDCVPIREQFETHTINF